MKIACHAPIETFKGEQIQHPTGEKATFRSVAVEALLNEKTEDKTPYELYAVARKLAENDWVDLTVEELALVKTVVGRSKVYSNLVIGRMFDIIEGR